MIIIPEHRHPHITRRAFCGALAVAPVCALGAGCSSSPSGPSPAAPIVAAPPVAAPPVAAPPVVEPQPAVPHGPSGLLPVLDAGGAGGLSVVIEGTPLASLGGVARAEGTVNGLRHFVLLTRSTTDVVAAINGICTHEGCIVTRFEAPAFECPCHGSRYDWRGTVLRGPAPAALPRLQTTFDGRAVRISV